MKEEGAVEPLITNYEREIFRPKCNPGFESVHCLARIEADLTEAIPYVNAAMGGTTYIDDPRAVMLENHGRKIAIHAHEIAINVLKDPEEADRVLAWIIQEINEVWADREQSEPRFGNAPKPRLMDVLKLLPRTNCGECGVPTCMVFATRLMEGVVTGTDCPPLDDIPRTQLEKLLGPPA